MRYLKNFKTYELLEAEISGGELFYPYVYSSDDGHLVYVASADLAPGTIVLSDGTSRKYILPSVYTSTKDELTAAGFEPIGVVVIPNSHTADKKARMMSLKLMDASNPDNGSSEFDFSTSSPGLAFGGYEQNELTGQTFYSTTPNIYQSVTGASSEQVADFSNPAVCIPSDIYLKDEHDGKVDFDVNPFDTKTSWASIEPSFKEQGYIPSPYLNNGAPNPVYRATVDKDGNTIQNLFSDMDGRGNTDAILAFCTGSTDWKTSPTIPTDGSSAGIYPAFMAIWRYHTKGSAQGDWYMPAVGELGYLAARAYEIQLGLTAAGGFQVKNAVEATGGQISEGYLSLSAFGCRSSSLFSASSAFVLDTSYSIIFHEGTNNPGMPVVAFAVA